MLWGSWKNSAYQHKHYYKREGRICFWTRSTQQQSFLLSIVFWSDTSQSINSCSRTDPPSFYFHRVLNLLKIHFSGSKCFWVVLCVCLLWFSFFGVVLFFFFPSLSSWCLMKTLANARYFSYFSSFSAFKGTSFCLLGSMFGCPFTNHIWKGLTWKKGMTSSSVLAFTMIYFIILYMKYPRSIVKNHC